jgi:hypothetical protein
LRSKIGLSVMTATVVLFAAEPAPSPQVNRAYLEGQLVSIQFAQPQGKREGAFMIGPWRFGAKVTSPAKGAPDKPHDKRLNLYIMAPGSQNDVATSDDFDHTVIVNAKPLADGAEAEFDVYYAVVLDPRYTIDVKSELDLLVATQEEFRPGDLFEFGDVPSADFLRTAMQIESLADLRPFRKRNGAMTRVIIVPAGFALRAVVTETKANAD